MASLSGLGKCLEQFLLLWWDKWLWQRWCFHECFWDLPPCHWDLFIVLSTTWLRDFPMARCWSLKPRFFSDSLMKTLGWNPLPAHLLPTQPSPLGQNLEQFLTGWITFPTIGNTIHTSLTQQSLKMEIYLDAATFPLQVPSEKLAKPAISARA